MKNTPVKNPFRVLFLGSLAILLFPVYAVNLVGQQLPPPVMSDPPAPSVVDNTDFTKNPAVEDITNQEVTGESQSNPAVTNITSRDNFLDNIFSSGSPFYFGLVVGETYDDNIFISRNKSEDLITHVSPMVDFVKGDKTAANSNFFNLVFRPTLFFYAYNSVQNRTDYYADAIYQHAWTRLTLSIEQRYEELTEASIDVGNFFRRDVYTTAVNASYVVDDHLSFAGSETQRISSFQNQGITNTNEWITDAYATYQVASKLSLGLGPRIGFADITGAPNQTYEDLLFRVAYKVSEKINLTFDGGGEYRQFQRSPDHIYPIFDLNATYTPFDGTQISASGYRQEAISYSEIGDDFTSTLLQANIKQRFLRNYFLLGTVGYNLSDYQSTTQQQAGSAPRQDNYYFCSAGLEWDPREWLSVSARYQYSKNDSTFTQNTFDNNQVDLQSSLQF